MQSIEIISLRNNLSFFLTLLLAPCFFFICLSFSQDYLYLELTQDYLYLELTYILSYTYEQSVSYFRVWLSAEGSKNVSLAISGSGDEEVVWLWHLVVNLYVYICISSSLELQIFLLWLLIMVFMLSIQLSQRKKCPYSKLFPSLFSRIRTKYGEIRSISPYSVPNAGKCGPE